MSGKAMWDACEKIAEVLHAQALKIAAARRERALRRRRERYAMRKALGIAPKKAPEPEPEKDPDPVSACYCDATSRPPCAWCDGTIPRDKETDDV